MVRPPSTTKISPVVYLLRISASTASAQSSGVADRPIGHLGLALVVDMAERISYLRQDDRNRILLALRREAELNTPDDPA